MKIKKMKSYIKQVRGVTYKKADTSNILRKGYIPLIRANNIQENCLVYSDLVYVKEDRVKENQYINKGDIIIASSSGSKHLVGKSAQLHDDMTISFGAFCKVIRATKEINSSYLGHYFKSSYYRETISSLAEGANINNIKNEHIDELDILVPPLEIQKQIVVILDKAQNLINNRKEQIELLDDLIESIFYDMFGDPVLNDKGWENKKFEEFSNVRSSKRVYISECVDEGIPFYRGTEISKLSLNKNAIPGLYITEDHYKLLKEETGVPQIGDLLLPSICVKGEVWRVDNDRPFYFKDGRVLWVQLDDKSINDKYVQYSLSQVLIKNFEGIASGSTFSEMKIFILKNIEIPIPPLNLQNQFAKKVQAIEKQKQLLENSLKLMEDNYNSLMQKAFKGELF